MATGDKKRAVMTDDINNSGSAYPVMPLKTIDQTPTAGNTDHLISSAGVKSAIDAVALNTVDLSNASTLAEIFTALSDYRIVGYGNAGNSVTNNLQTLLGKPTPIANYGRYELHVVGNQGGGVIEVFAHSSQDAQSTLFRKFLWMQGIGGAYHQSAWESITPAT